MKKAGIERVQALADISCSGYVFIATKPMHRLEIRPIVHKLHPGPCSCVGMRRGTDTQTRVTTIGLHFASSTTQREMYKCRAQIFVLKWSAPARPRVRFLCSRCRPVVYACVHRAISNLYYLMGKFGIRDRGEIRATSTFEQLDKVVFCLFF